MNEQDAFRIIKLISEGHDPYTEGSISANNPENNPKTVKALCLAITALAKDMDDHAIIEISRNRNNHYIEDKSVNITNPDSINKEKILKVLEITKYNRKKAAEHLGITYRSLRYKLKKFNID